ncbi:N-glycosyltransferase [Clostridium sp. N3C]|uniref:glycosyltransferase n=1 Tax=Clostridium sp. N3C TaxID=1776758 RepID=UPI00092DF598|nr:glycosyltransferase [Clostridium sp. N3C]SCN23726.1 N-glycosyltransferase [Clostridium sp. N3C]
MYNCDICFIILHYITTEETDICVDSIIKKIDTPNYKIVIVDNASPNNSGEILQNKHKDNEKIHVIRSKENLGFARGNNLGYDYAKKHFSPKFIAFLNNDTYLIQDNFFHVIEDEYNKSNFAVLGPMIMTPYEDSGKCNPKRTSPITINELNKFERKNRILLFLNKICLDLVYIRFIKFLREFLIKSPLKNVIFKKRPGFIPDYSTRMENVQLHGCCLIMSPVFIEKYDGFDNRTFLYMEEDLLYINMLKDNMLMVYNPELKIFHSEEITSTKVAGGKRKKRSFKYRNLLKSVDIVKKTLETYESK